MLSFFYPLLLTASVTLAWTIDRSGSAVVVFALSAVSIAWMEKRAPFSQQWRGPITRTDLLHMVLSSSLVSGAFRALAFEPLVLFGNQLALTRLWPLHAPICLQFALALLVGELGYYSIHRLAHTFAWAWRFHSLHHSVPRLYWLNAGVFHPLETLVTYAAEVTPLLILGAPPTVLAIFAAFTICNGMLKHSNVALRTGALDFIFSTPALHRFHHSRDPSEGNSNFGSNLSVLDLLLGSFRRPNKEPSDAIGTMDGPEPADAYLAHLLWPFRTNSRAE